MQETLVWFPDQEDPWRRKGYPLQCSMASLEAQVVKNAYSARDLGSLPGLGQHYFADKGPYSESHGFSSRHMWMWELDHKEGWTSKNWCFWTVVLKKTLESLLDCKEIQPVHPKGNQSWIFTWRPDVEAEAPILSAPDAKNWKDPDAGKD